MSEIVHGESNLNARYIIKKGDTEVVLSNSAWKSWWEQTLLFIWVHLTPSISCFFAHIWQIKKMCKGWYLTSLRSTRILTSAYEEWTTLWHDLGSSWRNIRAKPTHFFGKDLSVLYETLLRAEYVPGTWLDIGHWWWWIWFDSKENKYALPVFKELMVLEGEQASRYELWEGFPVSALQEMCRECKA